MKSHRLFGLLIGAIASLASDFALAAGPENEECPQGRVIRSQKTYPASMTDCEVLDVDTARENKKRQAPTAAGSETSRSIETFKPSLQERAVLNMEDRESQHGQQYVGGVIWRLQKVAAANNQTADVAVGAEIDIPDCQLKMTMSFRQNLDRSLPASHTMEMKFVLSSDFADNGVSNLLGVLMTAGEGGPAVPLAGLPAKVSDSFYMFGLSNVGGDLSRNLGLLKQSSRFDVALVYKNGKRAILSFVIGASGRRAFDQAFGAWYEEMNRRKVSSAPASTGNVNSLATSPAIDRPAIAEMERVDRNFWLAFNVSICQMRSLAWFGAVRTSWNTWLEDKIKETRITYDQANKISQKVRDQVQVEYGEFPAICERLRNSHVLDEMDAMETRATGNYH
jgi:hypothetical protein